MGNISTIMKCRVNDAREQAFGEVEAGLLARAVTSSGCDSMGIAP